MKDTIIKILEKCNEEYSNGNVYILKEDEYKVIEETFNYEQKSLWMDDFWYDLLYASAKEKWPDDKFFSKLTSNNTGYGQEIIHKIPMGSMDELKEGDWEKWSKGRNTFMLSDKLDGCSIILTYEDGKLKTAATRGKGLKGKDIKRHADLISTIKQEIPYKEKVIVRGELLFKKSMIDWVIGEVNLKTGKTYKNGRNMIAGLLNSKEPSFDLANANFVTYWTSLYFGNSFDFLKEQGFETAYNHIVYRDWEEIDSTGNTIKKTLTDEELIKIVKTRIKTSDYELDGVILTQLDNIEEGFETGTINPKASRKFKLGIYDNVAESVITNINWQISKFGTFTPVLEIEPVEISGCTVTNVTGHNYENVIKLKAGVGAKVKICRAGLVIPHLLKVLSPSEEYNLPNIKTKVDGVDLILDDHDLNEYSIEAMIQDLVYFGRKLNIDQMGYGNCKTIFWACMTDNIVLDSFVFLGLPEGLVADIIGKNGQKLEDSLKAKKTSSTEAQVAAALSAFGEGIGETVLNNVFDKYGTLLVNEQQLKDLEGFGEVRIPQYLNCVDYWADIRDKLLNRLGWKFKSKSTETKFKDYIVCFSGVRDKDLSTTIIENGGIATDSWKKDVNILVVKDKNSTSSKMKKAIEANVQILTLEEAKELFNA